MPRTSLLPVLAVLLALAAPAQAAPTAEPQDLEPQILSKLAFERAKARGTAQQSRRDGRRDSEPGTPFAECGALNIGNVDTGGRIGFQPREITVVVTGDVINANNVCR